jgi:AraC-like DNA-binding protein
MAHLDANIQEPTTLSQAAAIACMERTAFCKFFRRSTGICFMEFLHIVRINRAALLLVSHDLSITEVANAVGYESTAVFQRHFKAHFGMPARVYRARVIAGTAA